MDKIIMYIVIALAIYLGVKGLFSEPIKIEDYILFVGFEGDEQIDKLVITPDREMYHVKMINDSTFEYGKYKVRGEFATKYFPGLYCFGKFPLGLKYYKNPEKVLDAKLTLVEKDGSSFKKINEKFSQKIVIFDDKVLIDKHIFVRIELNKKIMEDVLLFIKDINQ